MTLVYTVDKNNTAHSPNQPNKRHSCTPVHEAGRGFAVACLHNRAPSREKPRPLARRGQSLFLFSSCFVYRVL